MPESANLLLQIEAADADAEELDRLARQLRDEIRDLDVESVELAQGGTVPDGSKAGGTLQNGALALALPQPIFLSLMGLLVQWLGRRQPRPQPITIELFIGERRAKLECDPATPNIDQLVSTLMSGLSIPNSKLSTVTLTSGGDTNIGQDVVGRDKISIQVQPGATLVMSSGANAPKQE